MIYTVTFNPAIDYVVRLGALTVFAVKSFSDMIVSLFP